MSWQKLKLAEFCKTGSGSTPSRSKASDYYGGTIPWVKSGELKEQEICDTVEKVTKKALAETAIKMVPKGALLIAMYGATVGRMAFLGTDATMNQAVCHIITDHSACEVRYLFYCLQNMIPQLLNKRVGGGQPNINQQIIKNLEIPLPPLAEQKRIAAILDKADAIRRKRQAAIKLADDFLRATFLDMFGDPVTNPKKWEVKPIGEMLTFLTSGSRGWAKYYSNDGALFLRIQNTGKNELILEDVAFVNPPESAEARRTRVMAGDVLLSITADLGRTAVIPKELPAAHINQHLAILRFKGVAPLYASAFLASPGGQEQVKKLNREGVKAGLNFDDIRSLKMILPPEFLQRKWRLVYKKKIQQNRLVQNASNWDTKLFNSLTQRAFRGEL